MVQVTLTKDQLVDALRALGYAEREEIIREARGLPEIGKGDGRSAEILDQIARPPALPGDRERAEYYQEMLRRDREEWDGGESEARRLRTNQVLDELSALPSIPGARERIEKYQELIQRDRDEWDER